MLAKKIVLFCQTHKTPANLFGHNSSYHNNFSCWFVHGKPANYSIASPVAQSNNVIGVSTQAAERLLWAERVKAAGVVIGPN